MKFREKREPLPKLGAWFKYRDLCFKYRDYGLGSSVTVSTGIDELVQGLLIQSPFASSRLLKAGLLLKVSSTQASASAWLRLVSQRMPSG